MKCYLQAQVLPVTVQAVIFIVGYFEVVWSKLMEISINPKGFEAVVNPVSDTMSVTTTSSGM